MDRANNGANLGFERRLWEMADRLRGRMDAAESRHLMLGLIFLKYISDAFQARYDELAAGVQTGFTDPENRDAYAADKIFWVPPEARWKKIQDQAHHPAIGKVIDAAIQAIERENPTLKGELPRDYSRPMPDRNRLGELVELVSDIDFNATASRIRDSLRRVYHYFLDHCAGTRTDTDDGIHFGEQVAGLIAQLYEQFGKAEELEASLKQQLATPASGKRR